ncbi:MAG: VirB8/TrbF family protein [Candidatus Velthaea sp.]
MSALFRTGRAIFNGAARKPENKPNELSAGQAARLSDYERALRGEANQVKANKVLGLALLASLAFNTVQATRPPLVAVYDREADGKLHFAGYAQGAVTPGDVTVDASIVAFVHYMRDIPGSDFRAIDDDLETAHRDMTVPGSPADRDEVAFWQAHNPKSRASSMTRLVLDRNPAPMVTRKGDSLTWLVTWAEQTKDDRGVLGPVQIYNGSVTMQAEPTLSTDGAKALKNPGGIDVYSFNLPEN